MSNVERRFLTEGIQVEKRDGKPMIVGYAAVFNTLSNEMQLRPEQRFKEVIRPGAFSESLASGYDVVAKFDHGPILGRQSNGTLRLFEDERGLRYEIDPADTTAGRDAVTLIDRKDVRGSSFEFRVEAGGDVWRREGATLVRELRTVQLRDVSPVIRPAYPATDVALRSLDAWAETDSQIVPDYRVRLAMRLALAERI